MPEPRCLETNRIRIDGVVQILAGVIVWSPNSTKVGQFLHRELFRKNRLTSQMKFAAPTLCRVRLKPHLGHVLAKPRPNVPLRPAIPNEELILDLVRVQGVGIEST